MRGLIMAAQQQAREVSGFIYKGVFWEYEEVTNPITGRIWMDRNLGASRVATAIDDADAYGDLFQWGRPDDLHQNRDSSTTETLSDSDVPGHGDFILAPDSPNDWRSPKNDNLWQPPGLINVTAPPGWRIPSRAEWDNEAVTWETTDLAGAFGSVLKLTAGGLRRHDNALIQTPDSVGYYWRYEPSATGARYFRVITANASTNLTTLRAIAMSVRLIKEV